MASADQGEQVRLGAADFKPSPDCPVGWRGDGNGRYPAANPPLTWGRNSKSVSGLCSQAKKPKADDRGTPMADGVIRQWLAIGPVAIPQGKAAKEDFFDEPKLVPAEGDRLGDLAWKAVTTDTPWIHFQPMYGKGADPEKVVAYAHAWVHAPQGKAVYLDAMVSNTGKFWLNGKEIGVFGGPAVRANLPLKQGWNSLLARVAPQPDTGWSKGVVQWHLNAALFGTESDEYESRNILWTTPMPDDGPGVSSPILVGNKLFVTAEGNVLICISAADGKVLWARSSTYADAATSDERQKAPEVFAQTDKLTAQLNESLQTYCQDPGNFRKKPEVCAGLDACRKVNRLVEKTDRAKYPGQSGCEAGEAASTPVSDGQHVYVLYGSGVAACFDLDGNRQWTTVVNVRNSEHGYAASPCLVDGKLVIKSQEYLGAVALDSKTGRVVTRMPVWKAEGLNAYSAPLPLSIGGEKVVVQSFGVVTRVKDGRTLSQAFAPPYYNIADYASPTAEGRRLCSFILPKSDSGIRLAFQTLPEELTEPLVMKDTRECEFDAKKFPCWFSYNHNASPLLYQGLAYVMSVDGVLTVIDAAKGEIVYQKLLDFNPIMMHNGPIVRAGCSGSPTLGGKHIYLWDNQGTCVVIEPGRTFKQLARNRIDQVHYYYGPARNECMISNPVFSGKRMYVRAENHLYCMGEKAHN